MKKRLPKYPEKTWVNVVSEVYVHKLQKHVLFKLNLYSFAKMQLYTAQLIPYKLHLLLNNRPY